MAISWGAAGGATSFGGSVPGTTNLHAVPYSNFDTAESIAAQETQKRQIAGQQGIADTAANAAMYPASLQQQRFNTVFPWLQGQVGDLQNQISGSANGAGSFGQGGPSIRVGGVYSPQGIQQQVNASNANIDRSTGTQNSQAAQQMGGRGFGSNSPLLMALQGQNTMAGLGTRTQQEQTLRTTASQQNQQAQLASQQAQAGVYGQREQEKLQSRGQNMGLYGQLIAAISGIG